MKYVLYKLVFGDPQGAEVLKRFKPWFSSMKELDEDYKGPDYYWNFFQLGELGDIRLTLLKWEIWSTWKDSDPTQEALSGYVGSSAGIFFYFADIEETWDTVKKQIEIFCERQKKKEKAIFLAIGLYNSETIKKNELINSDSVKGHIEFVKKNRGEILFIPDRIVEGDTRKLLQGFISHFIKKLNEELATDFNIEKEISYLNLFDVRELLTAEKIGRTAEEISLKLITEQKAAETAERESKKIEAAEQYILKAKTAAEIKVKEMAKIAANAAAEAEAAQKAAEQADAAQKYIAEVKAKAAIEASNKAAAEAAAYAEKIKMWKDKTQEEIKTKTWKEATKEKAKAEAEIYAISPGGEKVILENPSEGEIVDLVLQGYSLPSKYYIPRHCPKCGNFNQRMIFELTDRTFILMDYPRIYGLKCRCGNCGNEWHQK